MLRFSYLPSDFNPMLLMLGEAEDFRQLAALLRIVSRGNGPVALERAPFCAPSDTAVRIALDGGPLGLTAVDFAAKRLLWVLDRGASEATAELVAGLAASGRRAGSEVIEAAPSAGGIAVKLSLGEFTDDFLVTVHP
jgi:hypothetical protein